MAIVGASAISFAIFGGAKTPSPKVVLVDIPNLSATHAEDLQARLDALSGEVYFVVSERTNHFVTDLLRDRGFSVVIGNPSTYHSQADSVGSQHAQSYTIIDEQ